MSRACTMCIINNQSALSKAGCTPVDESGYCSSPAPAPPLSCTHTDSRGDSYDLTSITTVDQLAKTVDGRPSWYHIGICGPPSQHPSDPTQGCLPACQNEPGSDCSGWDPTAHGSCKCTSNRTVDVGGEAVCQFDQINANSNQPIVQYNCGMRTPGEQQWSDGQTAGRGVTVKYSGGSARGGCPMIGGWGSDTPRENRSTTILVKCDPCMLDNITTVVETSKCHYNLTISSIAGCATNKPLPEATCPHICDRTTMTCKVVPTGTVGANTTMSDCMKTCAKVPPAPPPPISSNPCIRYVVSD